MEGGGDLVLAALPASSSHILATVSTDSLWGTWLTATRVVGGDGGRGLVLGEGGLLLHSSHHPQQVAAQVQTNMIELAMLYTKTYFLKSLKVNNIT